MLLVDQEAAEGRRIINDDVAGPAPVSFFVTAIQNRGN